MKVGANHLSIAAHHAIRVKLCTIVPGGDADKGMAIRAEAASPVMNFVAISLNRCAVDGAHGIGKALLQLQHCLNLKHPKRLGNARVALDTMRVGNGATKNLIASTDAHDDAALLPEGADFILPAKPLQPLKIATHIF